MQRRTVLVSGLGWAAAGSVGALALTLYKDQRWTGSPHYQRPVALGLASELVVCYSRSGNSMAVAKGMADERSADLAVLRCERYPRSVRGQWLASKDAQGQVQEAPVEGLLGRDDLAPYRRIVLAGPTWWFRPAVPLWTFARHADWTQQAVHVVLTGNSRVKPEGLSAFAALLEQRGAHVQSQHFIARGRVVWQRSAQSVNEEARALASFWR